MTGFCSSRDTCGFKRHGASSLTEGWVCHVTGHTVFVSYIYFLWIYIYTHTHTYTCARCFYTHARPVSPGIVLQLTTHWALSILRVKIPGRTLANGKWGLKMDLKRISHFLSQMGTESDWMVPKRRQYSLLPYGVITQKHMRTILFCCV